MNLLQGIVLAVRVDDEDGGAVVGHQELFEEDAGEVAFAAAGAGDDGEVCAGEAAHVEGDGDGAGVAAEQIADVRAAELALAAAAEEVG